VALVELARFHNSFEAGVVRSRLEAEGIPAVLFDLNVAMGEGISLLVPIRLMVDDEDEAEARRIVAEAGK
jgi:hypothetical protein